MTSMTMKIDEIRIDGGTQPRTSLNEDTVAEYAEALADGAIMPEVVVYFDGVDHWLADGYHRYFAHRKIGETEIDADIRDGTRRDAVLCSASANIKHGLRRTNEDKRKAVTTLLKDAEWSLWSDSEIARQCGVSHPFVGGLRILTCNVTGENPENPESSLVSETSEPATTRTYTTKHGTTATMNVSNLGKARGKKAEAPSAGNTGAPPAGNTAPADEPTDPSKPARPVKSNEDVLMEDLERLLEQIQAQERLIKSLQKDDLAAEVEAWHLKYDQLNGRLRHEIRLCNEATKSVRYYNDLVAKVRKVCGVEKNSHIMPALVAAFQRRVA